MPNYCKKCGRPVRREGGGAFVRGNVVIGGNFVGGKIITGDDNLVE